MDKYLPKKNPPSTAKSYELNHSTALAAVAFQDQLLRDLSLNLNNPLNRPFNVPRRKSKPPKCVVNTGRAKPHKAIREERKEYVLDSRPVQLTLAQKLGLIEAPEQPLTEADWQKIKERSNQRDEFRQPCVICKEDFGIQEQALLSCTHVFHKSCIQAFERFTGKKSCPMCRRERYQTRIVFDGATYYKHKCATKIQALWRGYVVRSWYLRLRQTLPPTDPGLRKKFFEQKLHDITDRMLKSVDNDVDGFLRDLDKSLEASREVFRKFDDVTRIISEDDWEAIKLKASERDISDCPICLTQMISAGDKPADKETRQIEVNQDTRESQQTAGRMPKLIVKNQKQQSPPGKKTVAKSALKKTNHHVSQINKDQIQAQKSACHDSFQIQSDSSEEHHQNKSERTQVILSCSHVFHQTCLEAFEELASEGRRFVCPVCRSHYQKRIL